MSQFVTVSAGDVLSFDWNFVTSELSQSAIYNDFSFFTINNTANFLGSRNDSPFNFVSPPAGFDGQTDWANAIFTFTSAGTYQIGFGVFNVGDAGHNSALLLDNVQIIPGPPILSMITLACAVRGRRRKS